MFVLSECLEGLINTYKCRNANKSVWGVTLILGLMSLEQRRSQRGFPPSSPGIPESEYQSWRTGSSSFIAWGLCNKKMHHKFSELIRGNSSIKMPPKILKILQKMHPKTLKTSQNAPKSSNYLMFELQLNFTLCAATKSVKKRHQENTLIHEPVFIGLVHTMVYRMYPNRQTV